MNCIPKCTLVYKLQRKFQESWEQQQYPSKKLNSYFDADVDADEKSKYGNSVCILTKIITSPIFIYICDQVC